MALWATKVKLNMTTSHLYMTMADGKTLDAAAKWLFKRGIADFRVRLRTSLNF